MNRYPGSSETTFGDNYYESIPEWKGSLNHPGCHPSLGTDAKGYALVPDPIARPSAFSRYAPGEKGMTDEHGYMVPTANITTAK